METGRVFTKEQTVELSFKEGVSLDVSFLYIEWINNKVLLYSTENYIQYPMVNHNGKEYLKKRMCIYA